MLIDDIENLCRLLRANRAGEARTVFSGLAHSARRRRLEDLHMQMAHELYAASEDAKEDPLQLGQSVLVLPAAARRFRACRSEPHLMDLIGKVGTVGCYVISSCVACRKPWMLGDEDYFVINFSDGTTCSFPESQIGTELEIVQQK